MRSLRLAFSLTGALALTTLAQTAAAQPKEYGGFGERGRFILSADRLLTVFSYVSRSEEFTLRNGNVAVTGERSTSGPALSVLLGGNIPRENPHTIPRLSFDYTVIPQFTVGGSVAVAFGLGGKEESKVNNVTTSVDAPSTSIFGLAPRVGYILNIGDKFAFWPRGGFAFYSASATSDQIRQNGAVATTTNTTTYFSLDLDPQFVFLPIDHVGIMAGPLMNIPLAGKITNTVEEAGRETSESNSSKTFQFGITAGLLAWF